jgi:hypothetical protein
VVTLIYFAIIIAAAWAVGEWAIGFLR